MKSDSARQRFLFDDGRPAVRVMGVLNLTPDSFYGPSRAAGTAEALAMARRMVDEGADLIDVGAESSRPGSQPVSAAVEIERLLPLVRGLAQELDVAVSVDTWKAEVADAVLGAGAAVINDITALAGDEEMAAVIARHRAAAVLMHMQGSPETMQANPRYDDLVGDIQEFLRRRLRRALDAGIDAAQIAIDPGIGFGKTAEHNLELVARLNEFTELGAPLLLGVSRKSFIGKVLDLPVEERLEGSLAAAAIGVMKGARVIRAHDVAATARVIRLVCAIQCHERRGN
jgi:dihydropteroate synthase